MSIFNPNTKFYIFFSWLWFRIKNIFLYLYVKLTLRFLSALVFGVFSVFIFLPYPYEEVIFPGDGANNFYVTFPNLLSRWLKTEAPNLEIFKNLLNLPLGVQYYNFYFKHNSVVKENKPSVFTIRGFEDHIFWIKYSKNQGCYAWGCDIDSTSGGYYFPLNIGSTLEIKAVPINTPISYGVLVSCPDDACSNYDIEKEKEKNIYYKKLKIYATPNGFSWSIQVFLLLAFWIILINNLSEITRRHD